MHSSDQHGFATMGNTTHDRTRSSLPVVGMSRCQRSFRRHTPMSLQARRQCSRPCAGHNLPWRDILPQQIPTRAFDVLFEPIRAGALQLDNRIVMAPLTRSRAGPGLVLGSLAAECCRQRASAGLIVSEATQVSAQAQGYADTPGCYTPAQVAVWRGETDAVHANGGTIVVQLWHCGRVSHTRFQQCGEVPVGPSAIQARIKTFIGDRNNAEGATADMPPRDDIPRISARDNTALNPMMDAATVYGGGAHSYTDYPMLEQTTELVTALETATE